MEIYNQVNNALFWWPETNINGMTTTCDHLGYDTWAKPQPDTDQTQPEAKYESH